MAWVRFAFELAVTLAGSTAVFFVTGAKLYSFCGVLMTLVMVGLVFNSRTHQRIDGELVEDDHASPLWLRLTWWIGWALLMFLFWPVLPVVIAWKVSTTRA